ncbi:hypothetical protein A4H34_03655 [Peptidiphaga gingivicola]|uniref:Protein kinase domain-containing protein n=2 Tax=Peptidiphaga gingivicola TaxID=2741497 RepID=A0A179B5F2_9ACTO|nr:hypothetical protein A4H34_03655 [Peptidiphaga gingivicola]
MNIGGYRLIKRIGAGGMSTVFEAEDGAGVRVALKLLHPALVVDHSGRERLRREVAMLQKVRGRYVAEVLDAETDSDEAFIVTELIDGPTLEQDVVDSGVFEGEDLVELAEHLRQAVEAIHEAGVLHRDLKPSNVMLGPDGPVLIDFGIAQVDEDSRLTVPGSVAHTPGYCDPRVINGANPDESADWWALAAVLAFAATGRAPFGKGNPQAIMRRVFEGVPDIVGIQGPVAAAFVRALAPDIEDRIGIDELVEVLKTGRFDDDSSAPHAAFAGIAGVMGGVGSLAAADSAMGEGDTFEPLVTGETAARGVGDTASRNAPGATPQGATEVLGQHPGRPDGAAEALRASGAFGNDAGSEEYGDADYGARRSDDARGWDEGPETALRMRRAQLGGQATEVLGAPGPGGGRTEILPAGGESGGGRTEILPAGGFGVGESGGGRTEILPAGGFGVGESGGGRTEVLPAGGESGGGRTEILPAGGFGVGESGGGRTEILPAGGFGVGDDVRSGSRATPPTEVISAEPPMAAPPPQMPPSVPVAPLPEELGSRRNLGQEFGQAQARLPPSQPQPPGSLNPPMWNEFIGGQAPGAPGETPEWMRPLPTVRLIVFLGALAILSFAVRFPISGISAYAFAAFALAMIGSSYRSLNARRRARGGKFSGEKWGVALRLPGVFLKTVFEQAVCVGIGVALGGAALWGLSLAVPSEPRLGTFAAVVIAMTVAWFNGLNAPARLGARSLMAAIAPVRSYKYFWGVVLVALTALGVLYSSARQYPDWTPLDGTPSFIKTE